MSRVILLNGSAHENGNTYIAMNEIVKELNENGIDTELIWLGQEPVQDCLGCHRCSETGLCRFDDDKVNYILSNADKIDGIIAGSPVYYAGPSGRLCSFLDRLFYASSGRFAGKIGASVVVCRRGGASAAFERLNNFFLMNNMIMPGSQYWNMVYGRKPGDASLDDEGLQTMRTLAKNIAYTMKGTSSVPLPQYEKQVMTSFIR